MNKIRGAVYICLITIYFIGIYLSGFIIADKTPIKYNERGINYPTVIISSENENQPLTAGLNNFFSNAVRIPVSFIKNSIHFILICIYINEILILLGTDKYMLFAGEHINRLEPSDIKYPSHFFW